MKKLLFVVLIIAALFRFIGTNPGYHHYHADEGMSYSSAILMIRNFNLDPGRYDYPIVIPLFHALAYFFLFIPLFVIKYKVFDPSALPNDYENLLELWQKIVYQYQQTHVLFWGRYLTAFVSVGVVLLTYMVAQKLFKDKKIGLISAILVTFNFRQVLASHIALPDIYNAFVYLLSLLASIRLLEHKNKKSYLFAGILIGLSFSTKFQFFAVFPFLLIHALLVWQDKKLRIREILLAGLTAILIIVVLHPYYVIKWEEFQNITSYNFLKYAVGQKMLSVYAFSYLYNIGIGSAVSLAVLSGIILGFFKKRFKTLILLSLIIPFFYYFAYYANGGYYIRNFVSITPVLLIFAGFFIVSVFRIFLNKKFVLIFAIIIACLGSLDQIKNSLINSSRYTHPWSFETASNWAAVNIPDKAKVGAHPWDRVPASKNFENVPLEPSTTYSLAEMKEDGAAYLYFNLDWVSTFSVWWINRSIREQIEYWNKPDNILSNSFVGVVGREIGSFAVAEFVKPWQAPDMNIIITKVPDLPEFNKLKLIKKFTFDDPFHEWTFIDVAEKTFYDENIGHDSVGSIRIETGARRFPVLKATSPLISIDSHKAYRVEGWIKTDQQISKKQRDGLLRVDFYETDPGELKIDTKSMDVRLSSRVFGEPIWVKKEIIVVAKAGAKYMSVSLQSGEGVNMWLDDVAIYESDEIYEDIRAGKPYINYEIPVDNLFPFSQGGL